MSIHKTANLIESHRFRVVCDWKSATLNHPDQSGDMGTSLKVAIDRYNISPQLAKVLYNTMRDFGML